MILDLFHPSFLQNLRCDWIHFFYHVLNLAMDDIEARALPPIKQLGILYSAQEVRALPPVRQLGILLPVRLQP